MGEKNKKSNRKPATPKKGASSTLKHIRRKASKLGLSTGRSFKSFVKELGEKNAFKGDETSRSDAQLVADWRNNKWGNFSTPNLCIGKTKKKKGAQKK